MTIDKIYEDKNEIIDKSCEVAYEAIARAIENDSEYTLSDDELAELVFELIAKWATN